MKEEEEVKEHKDKEEGRKDIKMRETRKKAKNKKRKLLMIGQATGQKQE